MDNIFKYLNNLSIDNYYSKDFQTSFLVSQKKTILEFLLNLGVPLNPLIIKNEKVNDLNDYLIDILKKYNIYLIEGNRKTYYIIINKGQINFYIPTLVKIYSLLISYFLKNRLTSNKDYFEVVGSIKFRPIFPPETKKNRIFLGSCQNSNCADQAFISNYYISPTMLDNLELKFQNKNLNEVLEIIHNNEFNYSINKGFWRGSDNNIYRKKLIKFGSENTTYLDIKTNDYIPILDLYKYKYIIDIWGLDGNSARRFYSFHFNRVVFIPKEDKNKNFYEVGENKILPNVHYIEYSINNLDELVKKIIHLENNIEEYNRIRKNSFDYAKKYLTEEGLVNLIKQKILN